MKIGDGLGNERFHEACAQAGQNDAEKEKGVVSGESGNYVARGNAQA